MRMVHVIAVALATAGLTACSSTPTTRQLAQDAVTAMGGAEKGSPHVEPMVVAFVPKPGALFQSDLFFPGTGGAPNPAAQHLLESVRKLGLRVATNVGGHGGVGPFAEFVKAGTSPAAKTN